MSPTSDRLRRTLHFSGNVQGVGFRYTTSRLAQDWPVEGYVQNLPDGRVKLVVEGTESNLQGFEEALRERMGGCIADTARQEGPPSGEFTSFEIRH